MKPTESQAPLADLETRIGYRFQAPELLQQALTHKSYSNEQPGASVPDNERLEFLGDAVLDLIISDALFQRFAQLPEGELTRMRADIVSERGLAAVARDLELGRYLRLGRGEELSGGRDKDSLVANALEAVLGALYRDGGFAATQQMVTRIFSASLQRAARGGVGGDFKTRLQELLQARTGQPPEYALIKVLGPDHARAYRVEVLHAGRVLGRGEGRSKKLAEQSAARQALDELAES